MARAVTGNAYSSNGRWYARVSLGGAEIEWHKRRTKRPNVILASVTDKKTAEARAKLIADCARSLVESAHLEYVADAITRLAEIAPDDPRRGPSGELDKAVATVRKIVAGKVPKRPVLIGGATFGEFAERWTSGELAKGYPDHVKVKERCSIARSTLAPFVEAQRSALESRNGSMRWRRSPSEGRASRGSYPTCRFVRHTPPVRAPTPIGCTDASRWMPTASFERHPT